MFMGEISMCETLLNLPLFKGATRDQIYGFVEKTHLLFNTFDVGSKISSGKDSCRSVRSLISGDARVVRPLFNSRLFLSEVVGPGHIIGLERLFGLDNKLDFSVIAISRCGTMEFSKAQYLKLLQENQIFLMNCLNFLSRSAQKRSNVLMSDVPGSILSFLVQTVEAYTGHDSRAINFETHGVSVIEFFDQFFPNGARQIEELESKGLVSISKTKSMEIVSRTNLIDAHELQF